LKPCADGVTVGPCGRLTFEALMVRDSLSLRVLVAAGAVLIAFFGFTGVALEKAFGDAAKKAIQDRLQAHIYTLLASVEINPQGNLKQPRHLPESRFSMPGSGLYGFIFNDHKLIWRSPSALGITIPPQSLLSGESRFLRLQQKHDLWVLYYGITWESMDGRPMPMVLAVAEDAQSLMRQIEDFRQTLWAWLGGSGILLLIMQGLILGWSLRPLRAMTEDLKDIEAGKKQRLEGRYPSELRGLANNLNILLQSERAHMERYRHTLADLAHSLKTPLAVLRGIDEAEGPCREISSLLSDQVDRMQKLVDYQLQRAAARGGRGAVEPLQVVPVLERIVNSLDKVYASKQVACELTGIECHCFLEEGDLYEFAGNLVENAYKYCHKLVRVIVKPVSATEDHLAGFKLIVEDDGPGIPTILREEVLRRGKRADESTDGHGIGLAVVHEIIQLHQGTLHYSQSLWGGCRWEVFIPHPIQENAETAGNL